MATEPHAVEILELRKLTVQQQNAIDLLVTGCSDREVAEKVGVNRSTITRWRLYHPAFRAELNAQRAALWSIAKEKLRSLILDAVDLLTEEMSNPEDEHRIEIALALIKMVKLGEHLEPQGLMNARDIIEKEAKIDPMERLKNPTEYELEIYERETQAALNDTDVDTIHELMKAQEERNRAEDKARRKMSREAKRTCNLSPRDTKTPGEPPSLQDYDEVTSGEASEFTEGKKNLRT